MMWKHYTKPITTTEHYTMKRATLYIYNALPIHSGMYRAILFSKEDFKNLGTATFHLKVFGKISVTWIVCLKTFFKESIAKELCCALTETQSNCHLDPKLPLPPVHLSLLPSIFLSLPPSLIPCYLACFFPSILATSFLIRPFLCSFPYYSFPYSFPLALLSTIS